MITTTLGAAAAAMGAAMLRCRSDVVITGDVVHDSRAVRAGDLFFAIRGDSHDGHDFAAAALTAGAVAVVVDNAEFASRLDGPTLLVADTVKAIGALAANVVRRIPGIQVVAITGSSGKTTTKDLLAAVLGQFGDTVAPTGSFNNDVGLPMTVLTVTAQTRYLVLEMGARAPGDIARLCQIAQPDVGVVLNVGSAHQGEFGSRTATASAKAELVKSLAATQAAILNADDPLVVEMSDVTRARVITFGVSAKADVRISEIALDARARPTLLVHFGDELVRVALPASGAHQAVNGAAVLAAGLALGLPLNGVAEALGRAQVQSRWRMEVTETAVGPVVINDAYNANPESMAAALRALVAIAAGRTSWALLGEMRELGDYSETAHVRVGGLAAELGINNVVAIGPGSRTIAEGALAAATGTPPGSARTQAHWLPDADAALEFVAGQIGPQDVVLVKASRAVALERLADDLIATQGGRQDPATD